jgi:hypothetical protein
LSAASPIVFHTGSSSSYSWTREVVREWVRDEVRDEGRDEMGEMGERQSAPPTPNMLFRRSRNCVSRAEGSGRRAGKTVRGETGDASGGTVLGWFPKNEAGVTIKPGGYRALGDGGGCVKISSYHGFGVGAIAAAVCPAGGVPYRVGMPF